MTKRTKIWVSEKYSVPFDIEFELGKPHKLRNYINLAYMINQELPLFFDENEMWWVFDGKKYVHVDDTDVLAIIRDITGDVFLVTNPGMKIAIQGALRIDSRTRRPKEPPLNYILTDSGIYDIIEDKIIEEKSSDYFFKNHIPHNIGTSEDTPIIDSLIESWVGKEKVGLMKEMLAYTLYRRYVIHRLFCLFGSQGANGKSSFIRLLRNFLGEDNVSTFSFRLLSDKFQTGKLLGKLVSICTELPYDIVKDTDIIKQLTGDDKLSAEFKGKPCFDFVNYSKVVFSTNAVPPSTDKTKAYSRRWNIIEFPNSFPDGKEITENIPEIEYQNLLYGSLKRLKRIVEQGNLLGEGSREERHMDLESKSNPVKLFVSEFLEDSYDGFVPVFEFTAKFNSWCQSHGYRRHDPKAMWGMLELEGIEQGRDWVNFDSGERRQLRGLVGVKWKVVTRVTAVTPPALCVRLSELKKINEKEMASQVSQPSQTLDTETGDGGQKDAPLSSIPGGKVIPWSDIESHFKSFDEADAWIKNECAAGRWFETRPGWYRKV